MSKTFTKSVFDSETDTIVLITYDDGGGIVNVERVKAPPASEVREPVSEPYDGLYIYE